MKKWIVPSLLALALCLCLLPTSATAEGKPWDTESGWTVLTADLLSSKSYKLDGGKYYLDKDVTITQTITTAGADQQTSTVYITLDLNGHTLKQTEKTASVISPSGYVVLTIQDSAGKGTITSDADASSCPDVGGIYIGVRPTVILKSGTIKDCFGQKAGAVHVEDGGTFTMSGGTITGCHGVGGTGADYYPGGVYVDGNSTFTMTGGTIEGCFSNDTAGGANLVVKTGSATIGGNATIGEGYGTSDNNKIYAVKLASGKVNLAGTAKINGTYSVHVSGGTLSGADNGTVTGDVLNNATISGGTFTGTVTNRGTIENAAVKTVTNYGTIKNSTLGSSSGTDDIINCGTITGSSTILGAIGDTHAFSWEGGITDDCMVGSGTVAVRKMVRFNSKGGSAVDPVLCDTDGKATKPADPTRDGWSLYGWFTDESCTQEFDFNTALTKDITLYAGWAKEIRNQTDLQNWSTYWSGTEQGGRYLRLMEDITQFSTSVTFTNSLTIDLNGHCIHCSSKAAIQVGDDRSKCTVTITDRSGRTVTPQLTWAGANVVSDKWPLLTVKQGNTLCLQKGTLHAVAVDGSFQMSGGTVDGYGTTPAVTVNRGGSFRMSGGTVKNDATTVSGDTSVKVNGGGSFTLTGGTVEDHIEVGSGTTMDSDSTFTMSGGSIENLTLDSKATMNANGGKVTGTVVLEANSTIACSSAETTTEFTGAVTNGGTIEAGVYRGAVTAASKTITGGLEISGTVTGGLFYNPDGRADDILTETNFNNSYRVTFQVNGKPYALAVVPSGTKCPKPDDLSADAYGRKWLGWYKSDGSQWVFDTVVSEAVEQGGNTITLTARWDTAEAETGSALTRGQTYYFDLSAYLAEGGGQLPGTVNSKENNPTDTNETLPDGTLHYVPFTYVGQVKTYTLSENQTDASTAVAATRILFMADANLTNTVSWNDLNTAGYIYGKSYTANGVRYTLRAPTGGNPSTSPAFVSSNAPTSNDWDTLVSKEKDDNETYIVLRTVTEKRIMANWVVMQEKTDDDVVTLRRDKVGSIANLYGCYKDSTEGYDSKHTAVFGYRPVLELKNTADAKNLAVVTLELNGGKLDGQSAVQLVVKSGESYTAPSATGLTRPESSKDGTYFSWLDKSTGTLYAPGAAVPASVTTLTAQWVQPYSITYNLNGGMNHRDNPTFYTTENTGITLQAPTKTGYTFVGWYDNAEFEGSTVTTIPASAEGVKTFYAKWEANRYTIRFDANGGSGAMTDQDMTYGTAAKLTANSFTYPGYRFNGWSTSKTNVPTAAAGKYADQASVKNLTADKEGIVTLYAVWKQGPQNILRLNGNGGLKGTSKISDSYSNAISIKLRSDGSEFTREGYTFVGWYSDADGNGKLYQKEEDVPFEVAHNGEIVTLYAKWTPIPYTITYNGVEGATNTNPTSYTIESDTFTLSEPTCEGHAFLGWTYEGQTTPRTTVTIEKGSTGERVYTAKWKQLYTVTFDPNGGTLAEAERTAQTDISDRLTLAALPVPTRGGYRFSGWYTAASGGEKVDLEKVYDGNTTLYAHWTRKSTTGSGGTATPEPVPDATGGTVTAPEADNGGVSVSDKNAAAGETVTVVVTPDAGYALGEITVVDQNGNKVDLVKRDDGSYDFVMPSGGVTVKTDFVPDTGFTDVPAGKYFTAPVAWAVEKGITGGTDAAHFSPYAVCTRGQLVTFLWRAAGRPAAKTAANPFTDVRESSSFYPAILWAAENGIAGGYDDGTFRPDAPVTRQQVAAILYRYAKFAGMDTAQGGMLLREFSDYESVSAYALSAMGWAVNTGVLTGNSGALLPHAPCTRAQIVTMLYRLLTK